MRVLIESGDQKEKWSTVGVSENIMEASWQALADSIEYKMLAEDPPLSIRVLLDFFLRASYLNELSGKIDAFWERGEGEDRR